MEPVFATGGEAVMVSNQAPPDASTRADGTKMGERKGKGRGGQSNGRVGGGAWIMRDAKLLGHPGTWADCVDHTCPRMSRRQR